MRYGSVTLERVFFDKRGRRIPEGLHASICDATGRFRLNKLKLKTEVDYANRIMRLHGCLGVDTKIVAKQLKGQAERLLALIWENSQIANIANGVWLPVVLPQLTTDDLGTALEQYLEGVGKSYARTFGDRKFYNHRKGTLVGEVGIVDGSRHDQLIERMKQEPIMGIHFPNPLQGFSVRASLGQMSTLPERFILSGMDTAIAMVMYPDILARKWNTPCLNMAALSWQSAHNSLFFKADVVELAFNSTDGLTSASDAYSSGLLFLG